MFTANLFEYLKNTPELPQVLLVEDEKEVQQVLELASFLKIKALGLPDFRAHFLDDLRSYKEELNALFLELYTYYQQVQTPLIVAPLKTMMHPFPKPELLQKHTIEFASVIDDRSFKDRMHAWGYSFVDIVQMQGEISFRGDIIDLFPMGSETAYRISLFDDEVESIRRFDLDTQKSDKEELESCQIFPAFLAFTQEEYERIVHKVEHSLSDAFVKDIDALGFWYLDELATTFMSSKSAIMGKPMQALLDDSYTYDQPKIERSYFDMLEIVPDAQTYRPVLSVDVKTLIEFHKDKKITVISRNSSALKQEGIVVNKTISVLEAGYTFSLVSNQELIVSINHKVKKNKKRKASIILDELKPGDYVVHENYGVALFKEITKATVMGGEKEFVVLQYLGDDKVLIPVDALQTIDRYVAESGNMPALDRLGKGSFAKLKDAVKVKLFAIAGEIISLAAQRATLKAPIIETDDTQITYFQSRSGFAYTKDQKRSINEILEEMQSGKVMDRLLSGDVGFGKTEVAMNALFATVKAGYQAAIVVPTTLLSTQHFHSLQTRFETFDISVAKYDRFTTAKEKTAIDKALQEGTLDVVVGTHALFGRRIAKLGLVIIDEEHKFGVKQKEELKTLYEHVHLLSMSATPIPRSLNMALSHIKTMSQILTPPSERKGVRTFVKNYDEKLIKEIVSRELRRGGQVFYIFNNIAHMEAKKNQLLDFMPSLRITALHSKISAATTEKELLKFEAREYDMMLATSIIESGIHMPKVNTMIIDGSDRFGIADLHQLRGRVGRGSIEGYCYFLVEDKNTLTPESTKRLVALESNSYLGSGQALAYQDLEIRGGGNLVGDAQSGHIKQIGYALYLRMLEDALATLGNLKKPHEESVDLKLTISAFISERVVSEDRVRLELYRRLSHCKEVREVYEIEEEMMDRFGTLDQPTKQFIELIAIKRMAIELDIKSISNYNETVTVFYCNDQKEMIKSRSKDDDDLIVELQKYLRDRLKKGK